MTRRFTDVSRVGINDMVGIKDTSGHSCGYQGSFFFVPSAYIFSFPFLQVRKVCKSLGLSGASCGILQLTLYLCGASDTEIKSFL